MTQTPTSADTPKTFRETVLVTGGAGFIGAHYVPWAAAAHPEPRFVDLDLLTYAADTGAFSEQAKLPNVVPVIGDITDEALVAKIFEEMDVTGVIHFAAESHVDNSIADPLTFIRTNVEGTAVLLRAARDAWTKRGTLETSRFHHVSTDEVFGSLGFTGFFTEETPHAPNSPYSASKAASEHLVRAWRETYGMNTSITNCSNNYGPRQHGEKLIPTVIRKALAKEPIPIYGTGRNIRDWLWVEDHCRAVDLVFREAAPASAYVVGGRCEKSTIEMAEAVCAVLDEMTPWVGHRHAELMTLVADRPGHDFRYAISPEKIERDLGWRPTMAFDEGIRRTVAWYLGEGRGRLLAV